MCSVLGHFHNVFILPGEFHKIKLPDIILDTIKQRICTFQIAKWKPKCLMLAKAASKAKMNKRFEKETSKAAHLYRMPAYLGVFHGNISHQRDGCKMDLKSQNILGVPITFLALPPSNAPCPKHLPSLNTKKAKANPPIFAPTTIGRPSAAHQPKKAVGCQGKKDVQNQTKTEHVVVIPLPIARAICAFLSSATVFHIG